MLPRRQPSLHPCSKRSVCGLPWYAAISPAAKFEFHGIPFNVVRNSKSRRSNSGRLRTLLVLCAPLDVMISISSLRSLIRKMLHLATWHPILLVLLLQVELACVLQIQPAVCGTADQHAIRKLCARHDQLDTLTSVFPRAPRETPGWDASKVPHISFSLPTHSSSL